MKKTAFLFLMCIPTLVFTQIPVLHFLQLSPSYPSNKGSIKMNYSLDYHRSMEFGRKDVYFSHDTVYIQESYSIIATMDEPTYYDSIALAPLKQGKYVLILLGGIAIYLRAVIVFIMAIPTPCNLK